MSDEDRADHLSADEQRFTGRNAGEPPADLADGQRSLGTALAVAVTEPHRQARTRGGLLQRLSQLLELDERRSRLEPVGAVVAAQNDGARSGLGALHLTAQQFLGFALVLGGLQRVGV